MAPCVRYWWAVLAGTVSVPVVGGALWKQLSLAHARWRSTHARSDRDRVCAFEVLRLESPSAPLIPSWVQASGSWFKGGMVSDQDQERIKINKTR
jgi:hypothetical protein